MAKNNTLPKAKKAKPEFEIVYSNPHDKTNFLKTKSIYSALYKGAAAAIAAESNDVILSFQASAGHLTVDAQVNRETKRIIIVSVGGGVYPAPGETEGDNADDTITPDAVREVKSLIKKINIPVRCNAVKNNAEAQALIIEDVRAIKQRNRKHNFKHENGKTFKKLIFEYLPATKQVQVLNFLQ